MKVCGASGILRLREVLRHIQKNPHKKTHQLRLSGPSAATASSAAILPAASPATSPATADPSSNPWANLAPRPGCDIAVHHMQLITERYPHFIHHLLDIVNAHTAIARCAVHATLLHHIHDEHASAPDADALTYFLLFYSTPGS